MVKAFGQNPKDAGSIPAWHYSFPCIEIASERFYSLFIHKLKQTLPAQCSFCSSHSDI